PNALLKMRPNIAGTSWILMITTMIATMTYTTAMKGTTAVATLAIDLMPPKMTMPTSRTSPAPTTQCGIGNELVMDPAMELDWMPGSRKPVASMVTRANMTAYILPILPPIPFSM